MGGHLFIFGLGYTSLRLARALRAEGWRVAGTCRDPAKRDALRAEGIEACLFGDDVPFDVGVLAGATHILSSIPPAETGEPVLQAAGDALSRASPLWMGYLSTTGVYGDRQGGWVDATTPPAPDSPRTARRLAAEEAWRAVGPNVHIFRLAGIYGPGRSALDHVRAGVARRIDKPGHVFSRIHVDDIVRALTASMDRSDPGAIYDLADDEPAPAHEVVAYACRLLGVEPPPLEPFDPAGLSAMAREFYGASRRVRNDRTKRRLGLALRYPSYREGLTAIRAETPV